MQRCVLMKESFFSFLSQTTHQLLSLGLHSRTFCCSGLDQHLPCRKRFQLDGASLATFALAHEKPFHLCHTK